MENTVQRFLFEHSNIRGEIVSLDSSWKSVLERRNYPPSVRKLLGEITAATALLSATIKLDGTLSIQFKGQSSLVLLLAETSGISSFRSTAKWRDNKELAEPNINLLAQGTLAVTITPKKSGQAYQGLVNVDSDSIQKSLEDYMQQSEQLTTRLWLASNDQKAAGILLQKLPMEHRDESDDWHRITTLASTITNEELLTLDFETILKRLFHEETIRIFEESPVIFSCSCSEKRTEGMLQSLGESEVRAILSEEDNVNITCEFCGKNYIYSSSGIDRIFSNESRESTRKTHGFIN